MIRNALLGAGLVMSSASQFRIPGMPVGMGEICIALWIGLSVMRIVAGGRVSLSQPLIRIGAFWIVLTLALSIGAFFGLLTETLIDLDNLGHDATAYTLMALVTCLATAEPDGAARLRQVAWFMVAFGNIGFVIQIAMGWGLIPAGGVEPWYWDRFRGWSENPNQAALYCAVLGPVALHLALTSKTGTQRLLAFAGAILPVVFGRLTKSDTFLIATVVATTILIGLRLRSWLAAPGHSLRYAMAIALIITGPIAIVVLLPYGLAGADDAESFALSLAKDKGGDATVQTANLRLQLWHDALRKGLESASLGLGPGPHLERPNIPNLQSLPRPFEAHSTLLDLFTQGGALAILALVLLVGSTAWLVLRTHLDALTALVASVTVFGISHLILRHPIFWFALAFAVVEGCARLQAMAANARR
jgi:O-Antigen ligase